MKPIRGSALKAPRNLFEAGDHRDLLRDFRRNRENECFLHGIAPLTPLNTMDIHNLSHIYPGIRDSCDWCLLPPSVKLHAPSQSNI